MLIFHQIILISPIILGIHSITLSTEDNLIFKYFTEMKPVFHTIIFSCKHSLSLQAAFNKENVYTQSFCYPLIRNITITDILIKDSVNPWGVYVDSACYFSVLEQASNFEYFNTSYFWLIKGAEMSVLNPIFHIGINSQITFVDENFTLIDVFSYGRHLEYKLTFTEFARWNQNAIQVFHKFPQLYRKNYRGNFHQLTLRQTIVVRTKI